MIGGRLFTPNFLGISDGGAYLHGPILRHWTPNPNFFGALRAPMSFSNFTTSISTIFAVFVDKFHMITTSRSSPLPDGGAYSLPKSEI